MRLDGRAPAISATQPRPGTSAAPVPGRAVSGGPGGRVRRLLTDLRHRETRRAAVGRVRRRASAGARRRDGSCPSRRSRRRRRSRPSRRIRDHDPSGPMVRPCLVAPRRGDHRDGRRPGPATAEDPADRDHGGRRPRHVASAVARCWPRRWPGANPSSVPSVRTVATLHETKDWNEAWAISTGVGRLPGGGDAAAMGLGVLWHRRRQFDRSWRALEGLPDAVLASVVPIEAVDGALATGTSAVARPRPRHLDAEPGHGRGAPRRPRGTVPGLRRTGSGRPSWSPRSTAATTPVSTIAAGTSLRLIDGWLAARAPDVPAGAIPVGVIGYGTPDHELTSGNLGDHVQTLAMLGNLARWSDVTFTGEDGLGELATELQGRVRADLRRPGVTGAVHLVPVDRDFSSAAVIPERTWMVAFGWHMHPLYDLRYDFPYHPNVRPIFVSFHVNRLDMLTDEALAYLRTYGPVGCRDWTTVFLLLSAGVDAFFTGCLTTTVDAVFPPASRRLPRRRRGRRHRPAAQGGGPGREAGRRRRRHQSDDFRSMSAADGIRAAERRPGRRTSATLDRVVTGPSARLSAADGAGRARSSSRPERRATSASPGLTGPAPGRRPARRRCRTTSATWSARTFGAVLVGSERGRRLRPMARPTTRAASPRRRRRFAAPVADPPTTIDVRGGRRDEPGRQPAVRAARGRRSGARSPTSCCASTRT